MFYFWRFQASSSVQFSSVQFNGVLASLAVPTTSGASDREGTALRNWHGWTSGAGMVWLFPVPRVERARGPPLTSFGVMAFWPDKGRQGGDGGWRSGGKGGRGRLLSARHTLPARTISRMRVRATHRRLQHAMGAAAEVLAQDAEREQQREVCRRRRGQLIDGGARCTARVRDAGGFDTTLRGVNLVPECARAC